MELKCGALCEIYSGFVPSIDSLELENPPQPVALHCTPLCLVDQEWCSRGASARVSNKVRASEYVFSGTVVSSGSSD